MIAGIFHEGSGLGDQLFRYITVRTLAQEKGFEWGMANPENFKGDFFVDFDRYGDTAKLGGLFIEKVWHETDTRNENGLDVRSYDPEVNFVEDNTIIDGSFEDNKYWGHNLENINKWLAVEPLEVPDDLCVIGFRGGEYYADPDLGLPAAYYVDAIASIDLHLLDRRVKYQVHTDDPMLAREFFKRHIILPEVEIVENERISHSKHKNMGFNWRSARYAKYAIIPNSAFFIIPRLLKHHEDPTAATIAPRYWARRNTKTWARPACYYPEFIYV